MSCAASNANRARTLAASLAMVLGTTALYTFNAREAQVSRSPSDSLGSITLAVPAQRTPVRKGESTPDAKRPVVKTAIAWTSPWGNKL